MNWTKKENSQFCDDYLEMLDIPEPDRLYYYHGQDLKDWKLCHGAKKAVEALHNLPADTQICVCGDYDADGITATTIMLTALQKAGFSASYLIPNRIKDGYGLQPHLIDRIPAGTNLLITVDNGISSLPAIEKAMDQGMMVIVTDHHITNEANYRKLDELCLAIVHDGYGIDEQGSFVEYPHLISGAQTAYKLYQGMQEVFAFDHEKDDFLLTLSAISIVSDVMPLGGDNIEMNENREWLKYGMRLLNASPDESLAKLMAALDVKPGTVDEATIGFYLAPALNACGRLADADIAVDALMHPDKEYLLYLMSYLNAERKRMKNEMLAEIECQLNVQPDDTEIIVFNDKLHEGIVGILAGKLMEEYQMPVCVFAKNGAIWKGSARSPKGIHLHQILSAMNGECMNGFGGHAQAAGLSVPEGKEGEFRQEFHLVRNQLSSSVEPTNETVIAIHAAELNEAAKSLCAIKPLGSGLPVPFVESDLLVTTVKLFFKNNHACLLNPYGQEIWLYNQADEVAKHLDGFQKKLDNTMTKAAEMSLTEAIATHMEVWKAPYGVKPMFHMQFHLDWGTNMNGQPAPVFSVENWTRLPLSEF